MPFDQLHRLNFITLLGSSAVAWPLAVRAQQPAIPVIGFLHDGSFEPRTHLVAAFGRGLGEAGFVDGRDVLIEYHWAQDQSDRLPAMSAYLIQRQVAVIATPGSPKAFISADFQKILALEPDLVLTFSDLQADIAAELIRRNVAVHAFNHRAIAGILARIRALGALVGAAGKADALVGTLERRLAQARTRAAALERHPRVYFEEWDEPMISGIRWTAELIEIAGGVDVFPALSR